MSAGADPRAQLAARVLALPPDRQGIALDLLARVQAQIAKAQQGAGDLPGAKVHATRDIRKRRAYAGDPWAYFADVLGLSLVPDQAAALELLERHDRVLLPSANGVGKCVAHDDVITLADGSRERAGNLVGRSFSLITTTPCGFAEVGARAAWNVVETVYEITTESGRRVVRNGAHPLWRASDVVMRSGRTPRIGAGAWAPVDTLSVGDLVAVADALPAFGPHDVVPPISRPEYLLLAYLIGDGGLTNPRAVYFSKTPGRQLDEVRACADAIECEVRPAWRGHSVIDHRIVNRGGRRGARNPVLELVRAHGLAGCGASEKRIPAAIFRLPRADLACFLSRLFGTDGWACVGAGRRAEIGYCSTSEGLARDIHHLLLRFGIHARIYPRKAQARGRPAWTVAMIAARDLLTYADNIGIFGKEAAVSDVRSVAAEKAVGARALGRAGWRYTNAHPGTRWERVRSVRVLAPRMTVAVEVPGTHTFLSDLYEHNTLLLAGYGLYVFDAVAALENPDAGRAQQGGRVLLPGPDHATVYATIYSRMLVLAARAESRGHLMPGRRSLDSVLWRVEPEWEMEAFSPPKSIGSEVAASASGRHHRNQIALIEEGQGVEARIWRAAEGMCSTAGNKIASAFNPTEPVGPAYQRTQQGVYRVLSMDAFNHPNVRDRRGVIPDAISASATDGRVVSDCQDRGPYPATPLDETHGDFVYALPPVGADGERRVTPGVRADGVIGDVLGTPRVYRPNNAFQAQVRGQYSSGSEGGLFSPAAIDAAMARGRDTPAPDPAAIPADRVGADAAREGDDDSFGAPAWGDTAAALLRAYVEAQRQGPQAVAELRATRRVRVGELVLIPKGDGPDVALAFAVRFPGAPFVMDVGSVGASPLDHLARVLRRDVTPVSFGAAPAPPIGPPPEGPEPWSENVRTQMYVRAALVVALGLADLPDDPALREELLAHSVVHTYRTALVVDREGRRVKQRVPSVALCSKDDVKKKIGRSPDRSDALVLGLHHDPTPPKRKRAIIGGRSYLSV